MARIGLLGGSFDPIHCAHLDLARCAAAQLGLQQVWLIPAARPWQRASLGASPAARADMVRLAAAGNPGLRVLDLELRRAGPTFTIDTLRALCAKPPEHAFVLLLGGDQLGNFSTWKDWEQIAALVDLAVAPRPGHALQAPPDLLRVLQASGHALLRVDMPLADVSATQVRERAAQGLSLRGLVPEAVADYIQRHQLYRNPPPPNGHP